MILWFYDDSVVPGEIYLFEQAYKITLYLNTFRMHLLSSATFDRETEAPGVIMFLYFS